MPWLSIIFRISHSCLAAKFGLIGPALVHIMGATITCNLKPLMIKSSFIHDCAPQSLGPITFFFFFFFSISNSYFRHDISVRHQDYQITRGVAHEAHCEFPRSPVISVALHTSTVWISEHSWESKSLKWFFQVHSRIQLCHAEKRKCSLRFER